MDSKKTTAISLLLPTILSGLLLTACGDSSEDPQQDVYASKEECQKDWDDESLCQDMDEDAKKEYIEQYKQSHPDASDDMIKNMMLYHMFFGPRYYSGDRAVVYQGRTISPTTRSSSFSSGSTVSVRSGSSLSARPSISSPRSVSYGGFGGRSGGGSMGS